VALTFSSVNTTAKEIQVKHYSSDNLLQPFTLDVSISEKSHILVQASQRRGDVIIELKDKFTGSILKSANFPTEYPFDEILLISNTECRNTCTLHIRAKNKIDSVRPFHLKVKNIEPDDRSIEYLKALSQTGTLAYEFPETQAQGTSIKITEPLSSVLKSHKLDNDDTYRPLIHMRLAEYYASSGDADGHKRHLLELKKDLGDRENIYAAYANYELGAIEPNQSQEAQLYKSGMMLADNFDRPIEWAIGANYLATTLITQGEFDEAIDLLVKAEDVFKQQGSIFWMSYPLNNLSWANYRVGNFDTALKYAAQLKLISDNYDDTENEFWSLYNLGFIYQKKGDLALAQEFIDKSLAGINTLDSVTDFASLITLKLLALSEKINLLKNQGAYEEALDTTIELKQAALQFKQVKRLPAVLYLEAEIQFELGNYKDAKKVLLDSIDTIKDSQQKILLAKCYRKMAEIELANNETASALEYLTSALNLIASTKDKAAITRLLIYTLEGLTMAGGVEQAAELLPKIDTLVHRNGTGLDKIEYGHRKAIILSKLGRLEQAESILTKSLDEVSLLLSSVQRKDLRRSYFSLQKNLFELLIETTIQINPDDPIKSLLIAEQFKGLTLEEDLRKLQNRSNVNVGLLQKRHYLHKQLLATSKELLSNNDSSFLKAARRLSSELEQLEAAILQENSATTGQLESPKILPLESDQTLLYYFLGSQKSWSWVLTESSVDVIELPAEKVIRELSEPVIATYSMPPAARANTSAWQETQALKSLSNVLLKKAFIILNSRGHTPSNIVMIRDGALSNVAYAQLISPTSGNFMIADHAISYATSIESWQNLKQRAQTFSSTEKLTLVSSSAPYESGDLKLSTLPNTDIEISRIVELFADSAQTVSDSKEQDLVLESLLSQPTDILHFATHVSLNVESPYLSFVVLPESKSEERLWLSPQISSLSIPAKTVILSACESASGKVDAGEGMLSISRSFIEAGAANVIGSTRKIQDDSSAILMEYLYKNLKIGLPLVSSLQRAQTELYTKHPEFTDPYFWAGYQLMGAG